MGAITRSYRASADLTVTALHSLAASATWVAGWTSGTIDNTTNLDIDILITAKFTTHASNRQAGYIRVYVYAMLSDAAWPDLFSSGTEGTEGAATIHDTEQRDSGLRLAHVIEVDNGASEVYEMPPVSVASLFGGTLPPKFAIFVTGNATTTTTAQFAAAGSQVTTKGVGLSAA